MALVAVTVNGAQEAVLTWDDKIRNLVKTGDTWSGTLEAETGEHTYSIEVGGRPTDPWHSTVVQTNEPENKDEVKGVMDPQGRDNTAERSFHVR